MQARTEAGPPGTSISWDPQLLATPGELRRQETKPEMLLLLSHRIASLAHSTDVQILIM